MRKDILAVRVSVFNWRYHSFQPLSYCLRDSAGRLLFYNEAP